MIWRVAILLSLLGLAGCKSGASSVPPPGTGTIGAPPYYQPPATPYQAPGYGAPAGAVPGAINVQPGVGQLPTGTNPVSFAPRGANVNLAPNTAATGADGLAWQSPVTKQPTIARSTATTGGNINPQTTLTNIRNPATAVSTNPFVNANGQPVEMSQLPRVGTPVANNGVVPTTAGQPGAPLNLPPPPPGGAPTTPMFSAPVYGGGTAAARDPWLGR